MKKKFAFLAFFISLFLIVLSFDRDNDKVSLDSLNLASNKSIFLESYNEECRERLYRNLDDICLDKILYKIISDKPEKSISLLEGLITDEKFSYRCHALAHKVGKYLSNYISLENIALFDYNNCNYGFQHGALDSIITSQKPEITYLQRVCSEKAPNDYLKGNCNHALGHIIVSFFESDPFKAVKFCGDDNSGICLSGLMMSYIQGYGNPNYYSKYFVDNNLLYVNIEKLCMLKSGFLANKCLETAPAFIYRFYPNEFEMVDILCNKLEDSNKKSCYRGIASSYLLVFDKKKDDLINDITNICRSLKEHKDQCFIGLSLTFSVLANDNKAEINDICKLFKDDELMFCQVGVAMKNNVKVDNKYLI